MSTNFLSQFVIFAIAFLREQRVSCKIPNPKTINYYFLVIASEMISSKQSEKAIDHQASDDLATIL